MPIKTVAVFKPLVIASNKDKTLFIIASENSLCTSFVDMKFDDVRAGQLNQNKSEEWT